MAGYKSITKHNIYAHLDLSTLNTRHFTEIITFLRHYEVEPPVIRGNVLGHDVVVSAEHIRRVCGFQVLGTRPTLLDRYFLWGCFMRCKYEGDLGAGILNKAFMSPQFKYLAHIFVHCLGSRRGGFDDMRETIQCNFVALVLNRPFNFSEQLIDAQLPDLPKINADIIRLEHMNDTTLNRVMSYRGKERKPTMRSPLGHLARPDYVAPAGRRWRHADSDSELEDIVVPDDDDDDGDDAGVGDVSAAEISTSAGGGTSGHVDDDMDLDTLLDLDFLATTTASVSTPLEMTYTTYAEELVESYDSDGEGAGSSDSEDTPNDEFESVWAGKRLVNRKRMTSRAEREEITEPSFISEFDIQPPPRTSAPATTVTTAATSQAAASLA
ncbi:hypothetical protein R6Q57_022760 [Mikania cordata]